MSGRVAQVFEPPAADRAPTQVSPDERISGITYVSVEDECPRPHVGIVGAVHGNEPSGLAAIQKLHRALQRSEVRLTRGTLLLIHGNPTASEQNRRYTVGGRDLNRLFDYRFVDEVPAHRYVEEHRRALQLRPIVESLDFVLDLHTATAQTQPFGIVSPVNDSAELALHLGLPYLTWGWEIPGLLAQQVLLAALTRRHRVGLAVECGQHDDPEAEHVAFRCAMRFLKGLGLIAHSPPPAVTDKPAVWLRVAEAIKKPSESFRFARSIEGLDRLAAGELLGSDANLEFKIRRDAVAIMPNDAVRVGKDMVYLAHVAPHPASVG